MKDDTVYIKQMLESSGKIREFVNDLSREQFFDDQKTQSAVIMQLALIGELSKRVSLQTQSLIELPWKEIAGFRDRAIHDYFELDLGVVWDTIVLDLPTLEGALHAYLEEHIQYPSIQ